MDAPAIRLFSTDLDGTLLGNPVACWRFTDTWNALPKSRRPLLVYNTRRSVAATLAIVREMKLPEADYILGGIGTELHDALGAEAHAFCERLTDKWDRDRIDRIVATSTGAKGSRRSFSTSSSRAGPGFARHAPTSTS